MLERGLFLPYLCGGICWDSIVPWQNEVSVWHQFLRFNQILENKRTRFGCSTDSCLFLVFDLADGGIALSIGHITHLTRHFTHGHSLSVFKSPFYKQVSTVSVSSYWHGRIESFLMIILQNPVFWSKQKDCIAVMC